MFPPRAQTLMLLSCPELMSTGWPGIHSSADILPSWAPRTVCNKRPPEPISQKEIWPVSEAVASIGWPSKRYETLKKLKGEVTYHL